MPIDKTLSNLVINRIPTQAIYDQLKDQGRISEDELYFVEGEGFSIKSVSESASDGGTNTITFSDGKTINIKNGSKGSKGDTGASGQSIHVKKVSVTPDDGYECDSVSLKIGDLVINSTDGKVYQVNAVHGQYSDLSYTGLCIMGQQGIQGLPGSNGTSATHSWNGTTLTITSASGTSSANLKGDKGDKGDAYTLNSTDKATIVSAVISALPVYTGEVI